VIDAATHLASARFVSFSTWKWTELQMETSGKSVYRYLYTRVRPKYTPLPDVPFAVPDSGAAPGRGGPPRVPRGASHSAEIQYALGNLDLDKRYAWTPDDYKVSETMQAYFVNFVKTGNPNGRGLPNWPAYSSRNGYQRMRINVDSRAEPETDREQYLVLDEMPNP